MGVLTRVATKGVKFWRGRGVYFEAGLAMGIGINWIFTWHKSDEENLHFDTRQYNNIFWDNPEDLKTRLQRRILASIPRRTIEDPI